MTVKQKCSKCGKMKILHEQGICFNCHYKQKMIRNAKHRDRR
jgi:hypothetical protein